MACFFIVAQVFACRTGPFEGIMLKVVFLQTAVDGVSLCHFIQIVCRLHQLAVDQWWAEGRLRTHRA